MTHTLHIDSKTYRIDRKALPQTIQGLLDEDAPAHEWFSILYSLTGSGFVFQSPNWLTDQLEKQGVPESEFDQHGKTLDWILEGGRGYMVGTDVSMSNYIKSHRSSTTNWQMVAAAYCWRHRTCNINVTYDFPSLDYDVYWRGEFVEIALPHHGQGGEKHWVTTPPFKTKILVNRD